ncbi:Uncharacterised protein [uncultured archaeon]|nr:Uncharacterised protein [uncultured archaeon]
MKVISGKTTDKEQLINKIYELGFEVGYKNHSEIGWVLREYNQLISEAQKLGIPMPENYYNNGKIKGRSNRDKGITESSGKKVQQEAGTSRTPGAAADLDAPRDEGEEDNFLKRPSFGDIPRLVKKINMVELPRFLHGFKLFHK